MLMVTCISGLLVQRTGRGAAQGAFREHARKVALVVDRPAPVRKRGTVLRGDLARLRKELVGGRLATQELLRARELDGGGAQRAQGDTDLCDRATLDPERSRGRSEERRVGKGGRAG